MNPKLTHFDASVQSIIQAELFSLKTTTQTMVNSAAVARKATCANYFETAHRESEEGYLNSNCVQCHLNNIYRRDIPFQMATEQGDLLTYRDALPIQIILSDRSDYVILVSQ